MSSSLWGNMTLAIMLLLLLLPRAEARTWNDIKPLHNLDPKDSLGTVYLLQVDPMYQNTLAPTPAPTTATPTSNPTVTRRPTFKPTPLPTTPVDPFPQNDVPRSPDRWYFNYDTSSNAKYGPGRPMVTQNGNSVVMSFANNSWAQVSNLPYPLGTWLEFDDNGYGPWSGTLANRDPQQNQCGRIGLQSPIDLRESGAKCEENHQIRHRAGDFPLDGNNVLKLIESNKLRLKYKRRNCKEMQPDLLEYIPACAEPDPPVADFPNGWGGYADNMHVDFKIPSEHTIEGTRFDAEMQVFHLHAGRRRMPTHALLIQATDTDHHAYFEEVLRVFEYQYGYDQSLCNAKRRRERQLVSDVHELLGGNVSTSVDSSSWAKFSIESDQKNPEEREKQMTRSLQSSNIWDPNSDMLFPSLHFWRYDGSITEPPCGEFVTWFVCDVPMKISKNQLERMKTVLFTHVAPDCTPTSVHYEQSVARPIQASAGRPVWKCRDSDFGPDPVI